MFLLKTVCPGIVGVSDSLLLLKITFFFLFALISCSLRFSISPSILLDRKADKPKNGDNLRGYFMS